MSQSGSTFGNLFGKFFGKGKSKPGKVAPAGQAGEGSGNGAKHVKQPSAHTLAATAPTAEDAKNAANSNHFHVGKGHRMSTFHENLIMEDFVHNIRVIYHGVDTGKRLGQGMSCTVRVVKHRVTSENFALKVIRLHELSAGTLQELKTEICVLKQLDHPNIAKLYETYEEHARDLFLVMELCRGGELFDRLMDVNHYKEGQAAVLVEKMLSAICYCHDKHVVHRDLKLENFVFETKADDAEIKLIDFGLSKIYEEESDKLSHVVGTSYYIAPEVLKSNYGQECDMWSIGVIAYMLLSGTAPFGGDDDPQILAAVQKGKYSMSDSVWKHISGEAKDFIKQLLIVDPKKRMDAHGALKHAWITKCDADHPVAPISSDCVNNMRKFAHFNAMKRTAMVAISCSLSQKEIAEMRDSFFSIDRDHDGFITIEELKTAMSTVDAAEVDAIFEAMDESHTGKIEFFEFLAGAMTKRRYLDEHHLHDAFAKLDADHSGFITMDNLREVLGVEFDEAVAHRMIEQGHASDSVDTADPEKINYRDFCTMMRTDGEVESPRPSDVKKADTDGGEDVARRVARKKSATSLALADNASGSLRDMVVGAGGPKSGQNEERSLSKYQIKVEDLPPATATAAAAPVL